MSLERFIQAHDTSYEGALSELKAGKKIGHWIWWIFPQLRGLGSSHNSTFYGLADEAEARAYIQHPVLGQRYCDCVQQVYFQLFSKKQTPLQLMGSEVDVLKLRSSLELFLRHGLKAHDVSGYVMMTVKMEKILTEKLDWTHPKRDA
jgi:uncharacterized protein (DUF1810 family)